MLLPHRPLQSQTPMLQPSRQLGCHGNPLTDGGLLLRSDFYMLWKKNPGNTPRARLLFVRETIQRNYKEVKENKTTIKLMNKTIPSQMEIGRKNFVGGSITQIISTCFVSNIYYYYVESDRIYSCLPHQVSVSASHSNGLSYVLWHEPLASYPCTLDDEIRH